MKEYLDKEPYNQGSQIDFVITNAASNQAQNPQGKKASIKIQQQNFKNIRQSNLAVKPMDGKDFQDNLPLNIQAKSILNPSITHQ